MCTLLPYLPNVQSINTFFAYNIYPLYSGLPGAPEPAREVQRGAGAGMLGARVRRQGQEGARHHGHVGQHLACGGGPQDHPPLREDHQGGHQGIHTHSAPEQ